MRILLACVGRAKTAEQALCEDYLRRAAALGPKLGFPRVGLTVVETSRAATPAIRIKDEAAKLAARIPAGSRVAALDERGRALKSEDFATYLAKLRDEGGRDLVFVVGGPDGLDPGFRDGAADRLALGPQTWPHLLVRVLLAEQVYRAFSILAGLPYHRGMTGAGRR